MKKLLIIGASILQVPAIKKAREMGLVVAVADYNPQAVGIPFANEYFNASTIDVEAICDVAEKFRPDGIMTLATDMPMRAVAAATMRLSLVGISPEVALRATDKGEMIKAFKCSNVESPWYYILNEKENFDHVASKLMFPCIMKPTDNAGSRGVVLVKVREELEQAYLYSKMQARGGSVIVEEYLQGQEVSVEVMVVDGDVHVLAVTDKLTTGGPHFVEMGHSQQSRLDKYALAKIENLASRAVKAIGIDQGPAHVEIMNTFSGPKMIELGARMGGDCISTHLVPLSTGVNMLEAVINMALGNKPDITPKWDLGSAIRFLEVPVGKITSIRGLAEAYKIHGVKEICFSKAEGDVVGDIYSSVDRLGYVIAQGRDANEAIAMCEMAKRKIEIETMV